ncbi:MAG: hypothetical protein IGS54_19835 [Elainella sp. C42_A2020_010]|nr:hypothetical protein [Elainella sp. C42_A2020_010]
MVKAITSTTLVPESLQKTLDELVMQLGDRKNEVVDLLSDEQPSKSRLVDLSYTQCIWWEGCYYCQDEARQWHRIKCFI